MAVADQVEKYLSDQRGRLARRTIEEGYAGSLRRYLVPFCEERGVEDAADLTEDDLTALRQHIQNRPGKKPLAPHSVASYLRQINVFLGEAKTETRAKLPRLRKKAKDVLTHDELDRLEAAAPLERDKLMIRLGGDYALRLGEIAELEVDCLREQGRFFSIKVRMREEAGSFAGAKTGERLVPVDQRFYDRLQHFIEHGRRENSGRKLFVSTRHVQGQPYLPLREQSIYHIIKEAAYRSGLAKRIHPHLLRSTAITHLSERMSIGVLSDVVGASPATLLGFYIRPSEEQKQREMLAALKRR